MRVRSPHVAGSFYPADLSELERVVDSLIADARAVVIPSLKAFIVPHAGYFYSGPIAATAYASLLPPGRIFERVVIVGPAHFVPVHGVAISGADAFETPLGRVEIDGDAREELVSLAGVEVSDAPHAMEHCIEVELPFLQRTLERFRIVPAVTGSSGESVVAGMIEHFWDDEKTLVVVSSDLSHYLHHDTAMKRDRRTAEAILARDAASIEGSDACGASAIKGLLTAAERRGAEVSLLDLRTSGDTSGDRHRVVGYGAFAFAG